MQLSTFDIPAVQKFIGHLNTLREQCNGHLAHCDGLDAAMNCQYLICNKLSFAVTQWANSVISNRIDFDPEVERLLLEEIDRELDGALPLIEQGKEYAGECGFNRSHLNALEGYYKALHFWKDNWVSPAKATAPARRIKLSESVRGEITEKAAALTKKNRRPQTA